MRLNDLKIGTRLGLGFGAVLALLLVMVVVAYLQMHRTEVALNVADAGQRRAGVVDEWQRKTQLNLTRTIAVAKAAGQTDVVAYFDPLMKQTSQEISRFQKELEAGLQDDQGRALMAEIGKQRDNYVALRTQLHGHLQNADPFAAESLMKEKLLPAADTYLGAITKLAQHERAKAETEEASLRRTLSMSRVVLLVLAFASLCVGSGMAYVITRSVAQPLNEAVSTARVIASNDLSQPLESSRRDELGDLLRALSSMQGSLRNVIGQVRNATDSISTASSEIAAGNQDLSARTEQTASNLQQTASSMEELTTTVKHSADSARQANQLAASAAEVAQRGGSVVSQVVTTMDEINASSKKIADIIGVIDGIAFQTNILALNAAVEAARAGEQGRGFAVVASEVRSLASRSADAAKEIKGLIGASVDKVEAGSRLVADAGSTMREIVSSVQRVTDIIGEITAASTEQSDGIGQVNTAVTQLDQMTQQNAALVEESAAAAESLKSQAAQLAHVVSAFRLAP
jgi:methyl-accepting chemotaxis protein